jgi:hypothetical protein
MDSEYLRACFSYDDGVLRWKVSPSRPVLAGAIAGTAREGGYRAVKLRGKMYLTHRVIFAMHYGWWPTEVDHIDGNPKNNRVENLRAANKSQNQHNAHKRRNSRTPLKGVHWCVRDKRWIVSLQAERKKYLGGRYSCLGKAVRQAVNLRRQVHGEFARHA